MFTFLSVLFIVLLVVAVFYGYGIVLRKPPSAEEIDSETCTLCRRKFQKSLLVERQVGDSHLYYFCEECIKHLDDDARHLPGSRTQKTPA